MSRNPAPALTAALQPFVDRGAVAGIVALVADKDRLLSLDTLGFADLAARRPMRADSVFWIASQTKPITATALMMLVDEGKVRVDDPVTAYLPEFKDQWLVTEQADDRLVLRRPQQPVLIRHLLTHTSGLPFRSAVEEPQRDVLRLDPSVRSYALTPLQFEPGSRYQYSNAGINTVGRIIEVVSGMAYADFLSARLFAPLGMLETTFWPSDRQMTRIAKTYMPNLAGTALVESSTAAIGYTWPPNNPARRPVPGGGLFSTGGDVARFCQMILNGGEWQGKRYLSAAALAEMSKRQTPAALPESYGFGWAVGDGWFGHGGAFATNMTIHLRAGLVTVYLVQHRGFLADGDKCGQAFTEAALARFGTGAASKHAPRVAIGPAGKSLPPSFDTG